MATENKSNLRLDISSGPMMRELRRWQIAERAQPVVNRWAAWARSLIERHARLFERRGSLDLTLARQLSLIHLLRERWLVSSGQLNLTVHPLLRVTAIEQRDFPLNLSQTKLPLEAKLIKAHPAATERGFLQPAPDVEKKSREQRLAGKLRAETAVALFEPRRDSSNPVVETGGRSSYTPLEMVFDRVQEAQRLMRVESLRTVIDRSAQTIVHRIARQSQRIEETTSRSTELVTRRAASVTGRPPSSSIVEQKAHFPAETTVHTSPWSRNATPQAAINIEQVADQVIKQLDRRVVAMRERLGKV